MSTRFTLHFVLGFLFLLSLCCLQEAQADIPAPPARPAPGLLTPIKSAQQGTNNVKIYDEDKTIKERNLKAIDQLVKHMVYHANKAPFNGEDLATTEPAPFGTFDRTPKGLYAELKNWTDMTRVKGKWTDAQYEYAEAFASVASKDCLKVINEGTKPIERINGVRMLAEVGNMPYGGTIDSLLPLITDAKYADQPAISYVALEGIRNVLSHVTQDDTNKNLPMTKDKKQEAKRQAEVFDALLKFQPPVKLSPKMTLDDELKYRVYRRSVYAAIANFRDPAIRDDKKAILARPGVLLAKLAIRDPNLGGLPPSIADRVEAVCGLLNMNIDIEENFDVRIFVINRFLVEFGTEYGQDLDQSKKEGRGTSIPWKISAARISAGSTQLSNTADANTKLAAPLKARIKALASDAQTSMLSIIEDPSKKAVINDQTLRDKLKAVPMTGELFKGDKESILTLPD